MRLCSPQPPAEDWASGLWVQLSLGGPGEGGKHLAVSVSDRKLLLLSHSPQLQPRPEALGGSPARRAPRWGQPLWLRQGSLAEGPRLSRAPRGLRASQPLGV